MKYLVIGLILLIPSVLERVYYGGPHLGGVAGILIGGYLILKGVRALRIKRQKNAEYFKELIRSVTDLYQT